MLGLLKDFQRLGLKKIKVPDIVNNITDTIWVRQRIQVTISFLLCYFSQLSSSLCGINGIKMSSELFWFVGFFFHTHI